MTTATARADGSSAPGTFVTGADSKRIWEGHAVILEPKGEWLVTLRRTVTTEMVVNSCTQREAREYPYGGNVVSEDDVNTEDWEVLKVEPNS